MSNDDFAVTVDVESVFLETETGAFARLRTTVFLLTSVVILTGFTMDEVFDVVDVGAVADDVFDLPAVETTVFFVASRLAGSMVTA